MWLLLWGGNPEIIEDGISGLVTELDEVQQFSNAILSLIEDSALRDEIARRSKIQFDLRFTLGNMVDSYQQLYSNCY